MSKYKYRVDYEISDILAGNLGVEKSRYQYFDRKQDADLFANLRKQKGNKVIVTKRK